MDKAKKTELEMKIKYIEQYETLRIMYKYACRYIHEQDMEDKEQQLNKIEAYFSKQKRKIDNKCRKKLEMTLLGVILEVRPDLLEDSHAKVTGE